MRTAAVLAAYAGVLAFGLYLTFAPTFDSRFVRVQHDRGDTVLNHYILEHSWQVLSNPGYRGALFSPPFFFPEPHTLWYSEHLLGVAPVYWALRLAVPDVLAFQWWKILCEALDFIAFAWLVRRLGCPHILALLGGYLWAFGLVHLEQLKHEQLVPRFWMPVAVYYAWSFALVPALRSLNRMLACTFLQCSICMNSSWFLVMGLATFLPLAIALREGGWAETRRFLIENRRRVAIVLGVWAVLHVTLFVPYMVVNADVSRAYEDCYHLMPTPAAWLTGPPGTTWDATLGPRATDLDQPAPGLRPWVSAECWLFCGFGLYGLLLAASIHLILSRSRHRPEFALVAAALLTSAIWVVLTLTPREEGHSLWELVRFIPGATAIRCVSRVYLVVYLFGTLAALVWLARVTETLRQPVRFAFLGLISLAIGYEQMGFPPQSFDQKDFYGLVDRAAERVPGADALYVQPRYTDTTGYVSSGVFGEVFAMWVGLRANVPVINGYSGRIPAGDYPWHPDVSDSDLVKWLSGRFHGRLVILDPDTRAIRTIVVE